MRYTWKAPGLALLFGAGLFAQSTAAVQEHADMQQDRIANGVRTGELTPKEAAKLQKKEAKLNRDMIKRSSTDDHLSRKDRRKIARKENKLDRKIDKAETNDSYVK